MEWITHIIDLFGQVIDLFMNIDQHLEYIAREYGTWLYLILIAIVFCETGLVVTPFLPGDSLLFAAGAIAGMGHFEINIWILWSSLFAAAILGDWVNYHIGAYLGVKPFKEDARIFKLKYLHQTEAFYQQHGGKTIVIARFIPIVRTFAPFVAGASKMTYQHFSFYNISGAFLWTAIMLGGGYFFGTHPWVKQNFSLVVILIILISVAPIAVEIVKHYLSRHKNKLQD